MRFSVASCCVLVIGAAIVAAQPADENCQVTITLTDAQTGRAIPGLIRIQSAAGEAVLTPELLSRGLGLQDEKPIGNWSALVKPSTLSLPKQKLKISAFSGLETEMTTLDVDLTRKSQEQLTIPLQRFYSAADRGYRSANTHLHLMKVTRAEADRYLTEVPKADGLDIVFLSYLERAVADLEYTSNKYTDADLANLSQQSNIGFGNGEEHRHNFGGGGEGYGHVMLLNIKQLIQPVSIGPGIMKVGSDGIPIQRGIDTARRDGAKIVWCHNDWGMEDLANLVTGRLDAQNIFDGGIHSSYKHSFYRYLNAGFDVPFSTGTDWFMYDFSRVYVAAGKYVTPEQWLEELAAGKTYITNGPLLEFDVAGQGPGANIDATKGKEIKITGRGWGRNDFQRLELIQNGKVIQTAAAKQENAHYKAEMAISLRVDEPCWLALRTPAPPLKDDPELTEPVGKNEFGKDLFAHTSAVRLNHDGRRYADQQVAQGIIDEMQNLQKEIAERSNFADAQERSRVLDVYADAIAAMRNRIKAQE